VYNHLTRPQHVTGIVGLMSSVCQSLQSLEDSTALNVPLEAAIVAGELDSTLATFAECGLATLEGSSSLGGGSSTSGSGSSSRSSAGSSGCGSGSGSRASGGSGSGRGGTRGSSISGSIVGDSELDKKISTRCGEKPIGDLHRPCHQEHRAERQRQEPAGGWRQS
jgi:hypothetical protein